MTCEVCDREECQRDRFAEPWDAATMAEVDECAAHAVNWRDLAIAGRAREAALTVEVERLTREAKLAFHAGAKEPTRQRDEHRAALNRIADGLNVVHEDAKIVAAVRAVCRDLAAARADAANARAVATEAIDLGLSYADDAREYGFGGPAAFATLRARLASPDVTRLVAMVDELTAASAPDPTADPLDHDARHSAARLDLLDALGAKES